MASDEDLKLSDTLRFYMRDSFAAKRLLYRRLRCLADYENANRNLEKVRTKNKDVHAVSWLHVDNKCKMAYLVKHSPLRKRHLAGTELQRKASSKF